MMKSAGKLIWILVIMSIQHLPAQYLLEKLGPEINSSVYDEISPVVSRDGRTLYFTRTGTPDFNRTLIQDEVDLSKTLSEPAYLQVLKDVYSEIANQRVESPVNSFINQDIWIADSRNHQFDRVFQPGFPINNALPNSVCSLSPIEGTLVIINHFARDGSMFKGFSFIDRKPDGSFTFPDPIYVHDFYSSSPEVNLCMSRDGDVLILSLNRKDSHGENDLYVSFKLKYNLWSEPVNLGPVVNSSFRDLTPFISEDKSRLLFASNRPGGKGGTDIYMTKRLDYTWSSWTKPELLISPVNSPFDDSNPVLIDPHIYFTSKRDGTSDIFRVEYHPAVPRIEQPIVLKGSIRHSVTGELMEADLWFGASRLPAPDQRHISSDGRFEIKLDKSDVYRLLPKKQGFTGKGQLVDIAVLDQSSARVYEIDFFLVPLEVNQKIEVNNLYFERGKPNLLPVSYPELDRLVDLLDHNPRIRIRIEGHTDSVGNYYELLDLSRARADSVKKYLVDHGIVSGRIATEGFGGTRPISENNTEENRALNRRVEIFITHADRVSIAQYKNLPDPTVRISKDTIIKSPEVPTRIDHPPLAAKKELPPAQPPESGPVSPSVEKEIHRIYFIQNELAIEESSFVQIRRLIDFLVSNPDKKIILKGMCNPTETIPNPALYAKQRAMGVKEYLVFKSIAPDRISVANLNEPDQQDMCGVKVFIQD
jgi:outer membrane protein OmpA-like peptidoglycan-associated protein